MTKEVSKPAQTQVLSKWQQALVKAEGKFLAISGKEEQTKIELGFASMLIQANAKLQSCDPASIINAVINVARTGITLNPVLKLAHLVPRGGKCVLDFDYKGLVKVLKDNKCLKDIQAIIVYEDEVFEEANSPITPPKHEKKYAKTEEEQKQRTYKGVYSQVLLMDNTVIYTPFMPYWEVLKAEKVSPASSSNYSPWQTWREPMVKKTKIKRDFNMLISGSPAENLVNALAIEEENSVDPKFKKSSLSDQFQDAEIVEEVKNETEGDLNTLLKK